MYGRSRIWFPIALILLAVPVTLFVKAQVFDKLPGHYFIKAEFTDASGLVENSHVKIGGVEAGRIEGIELTGRDTAVAEMVLDEGAEPIGAGASAAARPVNLLGEKYVDLEVGDLRRPQPSGAKIPISRTTTPVELDDLLNMLDPSVRARLRILINEAGLMLAGRGADFNGLLEEMPPAIDEVHRLVSEVESENRRLGLVLEQGDRVLGAITPRRNDLGELVESAGDALEVTTSRRVSLARTLRTAPPALRELRFTLAQMDSTAQALRPAAYHLRQAAAPLNETMLELPGFADASRETLRAARIAAPHLTELGEDATPIVDRLQPTAEELENFSRSLGPVARYLDQGTFGNMLGLVHGWANSISSYDGLGHVFGIRAYVDQTAVKHALDRYAGITSANGGDDDDGRRERRRGGSPLPQLPQPNLPTPRLPVGQQSSAPQGAAAASDSSRLLDYLFGP